jgi:hypothetical protein
MNGAQIRVVKEVDEEGFGGLLQRLDSLTLPSSGTLVCGDHLRNFSDLAKVSEPLQGAGS